MASLTTTMFSIPTMASVAMPRRTLAAVCSNIPAKHQLPSKSDNAHTDRHQPLMFGASLIMAMKSTGRPVQATPSTTSPVLGGWAPINTHDTFVQELGKWAVMEYNKENAEELEFCEVVSGEKQIVSGTNYRLQVTTVGSKLEYSVEVYVSLDGDWKLIDFKPRLVTGGWTPIDVHDAYVQEIGKWAVMKYNKESDEKVEFLEVVSGEKQIVSGANYRLQVTTVGSKLEYSVEVYVSLDGDRKLIEFKPRPVIGGWTPIDVHDAYVQDLGKWAVIEYNMVNGETLAFHEVLSGEKQIVSGTNYRLLVTTVGRKLEYLVEVYVSSDGDRKLIDFKAILVPGGWIPIDVHEAYVQEFGKWAVTEYNKDKPKRLEFREVVAAQKQIVSGTNYRLILTTFERELGYSAVVYVTLDGDRKLIDFKPLLG